MLPGVSQSGNPQVSVAPTQSQRPELQGNAITDVNALKSGVEKSGSDKPQALSPDVQVDIRSNEAAASEALVVTGVESNEKGAPAENSTQAPKSASGSAQAEGASEQATGANEAGADSEQAQVGLGEERVAAQSYATQAQGDNPKGGALDLVV